MDGPNTSNSPKWRAVVADELPLVRAGIAAALGDAGIEVVGTTHGAREAASFAALERADLVVAGRVADATPEQTARRCAALRPRPVIVLLLPPGHEGSVPYLIALGVQGIGLRAGSTEELCDLVERAGKGEQVTAAALLPGLVGAVRPRPDADDSMLTSREREVLAFLAQGASNREIAASLSVTLATVKSHLVRIYAKLGAQNRRDALGRAVALGLLS